MRIIPFSALVITALTAAAADAQNPVVSPPIPQSDVVVSLSEFLSPGTTPFRAFNKAFDACRERRAAKLVIPPGRYVFDDPQIMSVGGSHIPVYLQTDLVVEGQGAELVFRYVQPGIGFTACRRVLLRDVAIDWELPLASAGRVIRGSDGRVKVRIADEYPVTSTTPIAAVSEFDLARRSWAKTRVNALGEVYFPRSVEMVAPQTFYSPDFASLPDDLPVIVRHYVESNASAIEGNEGNDDLTFEGVTVYQGPGLAFAFALSGRGIRLSACKVLPKPGTNRLISTNADGANFTGTRGNIIVEDCEFTGQGDDALNIHGQWLGVESNNASNVVELKGAFGTHELMVAADDRLRFAASRDLSALGEYDVRSVSFDKTRSILTVTLDRPLTAAMAGDLAINLNRISSNFLVRRNYFHNTRGHGLVIQTTNGRVENNTVGEVAPSGLRLTADAAYFWEGPGCENVVVTGNTFRSCAWGSYARWPNSPALSLEAFVPPVNIPVAPPIHMNITIERNTITDSPGLAIFISSAAQVTVASNEIIDSNLLAFPSSLPPLAGSLMVTYASSVIIQGNKQTATQPTHAAGIFVDQRTTSGVTLIQNSMPLIGPRRRAAKH